jgi:small subunit ribosomal protein S14
MAKECLRQKHQKQQDRWKVYLAEREKVMALPEDQREEAFAELEARRIKNRLYKTRQYNRCSITGRASGYVRFFGVCRHVLREKAHIGELPGVTKSSW